MRSSASLASPVRAAVARASRRLRPSRGLCSGSGGPPPATTGPPPLPPPEITGPVPPIRPALGQYSRKILRQAKGTNPYDLVQMQSFMGFSSRRTHPTAYNYLLGYSGGQAIIDPEETLTAMRRAVQLLKRVSFRGGRTLFVSTQPQLARLCRVLGEQTDQFYLAKRWVPGMLTNWQKSREHVHSKLHPSKPRLSYSDLQKANYYRGIEQMTRPPDLIFRLDATPLYGEPQRLNVPLLSVVDSDSPADEIDYPIPANTKSLRFYHTLAHMLVRAVNEGKALRGELEHYAVRDQAPESDDRRQRYGGAPGRGGGARRGGGGGGGFGGGGGGDRRGGSGGRGRRGRTGEEGMHGFRAPDKFGHVRAGGGGGGGGN